MKSKVRKIQSVIAISMLLITSCVYADFDKSAMHNIENRLLSLEQKYGTYGMINPPGMPLTRNGWNIQISADALLWQLRANTLEYVLETKNSNNLPRRIEGIEEMDPSIKQRKYNWGFRIGLDYTLSHDNWDIATTWTHIVHDYDNHTSSDFPETILTRVQGSSVSNGYESAKARFDASLDQICLNLGREFFMSKWVTLRPYFGLRANWLHQKLHATFLYATIPDSPYESSLQKNHWWGIGIASGLNAKWNFYRGFNLYGNLATAIEYGYHKLELNEDDGDELDTLFRTSYRICRPMLDIQLGVGWDANFLEDSMHFGVRIGWENHVYFNQCHFLSFGDIHNYSEVMRSGNVTYQGMTLSANLDF
jgi:hypothetical protein